MWSDGGGGGVVVSIIIIMKTICHAELRYISPAPGIAGKHKRVIL